MKMDFPVEATVRLDVFRDHVKVRELLRSHGFVATDLSRDQVRVKGSFLKLQAVKARLEQLLNSQKPTETTRRSSSPFSSGAISKYYADSRPGSGGDRGRLGSSDGPLFAHPSSPNTSAPWTSNMSRSHQISSEHRAAASTRAKQRDAFRAESESFVVDADVFRYARQLRKKDLDMILETHNVRVVVDEVVDSFNVTLLGKSARAAAGKLQSLLSDLSKSLRTQEVPLRDMDAEGKAFLNSIRRNNNVHDSVLVCEMNDRLHLIGSSVKSYEVKQKLLGRSAEQSGRAGRTFEKNSRRRSSSLPPTNRPRADMRDITYSSPAGAAGYSPSKYQDEKQEGAGPVWEAAGARPGQSRASRRQSFTESREKGREEKPHDFAQETNNSGKPPRIKQLLVCTKHIQEKLQGSRKK
ncbi:RNA-binding protein 43 isoform X2 [Paralichthys olivaceus]|uniref:RNA-binding protein 43 isoform X2 n=1 Tax=Paralichthys olivaceus TaxID=8255 RepID=UPI003752DDF0